MCWLLYSTNPCLQVSFTINKQFESAAVMVATYKRPRSHSYRGGEVRMCQAKVPALITLLVYSLLFPHTPFHCFTVFSWLSLFLSHVSSSMCLLSPSPCLFLHLSLSSWQLITIRAPQRLVSIRIAQGDKPTQAWFASAPGSNYTLKCGVYVCFYSHIYKRWFHWFFYVFIYLFIYIDR